ncbi:urea ABC transporter permease subunit UrtB [Frigidibacter sp. ROC022]|uniref:urea ABC transporter permease subunit UrtB n=1 Tax=Frigidibacter sp. ROC022 TaxID=2971796 RepID=UPI00215A30BE|nr:urea ABC transporter permease subunit UrtB [Frigidibacter sp. ROC022]MCR8726454.1 urea ABC transporter permease subunit UrtB [Frigidibacter sp. ROC022]
MLRFLLAAVLFCASLAAPLRAQETLSPMQALMQAHAAEITKGSRKGIEPAITAIAGSGLPAAETVLEAWQAKEIYRRKDDGLFFRGEEPEKGLFRLHDLESGAAVGDYPKDAVDQLKPNSGIRAMIAAALVPFQLQSPDRVKRENALQAIQRDAEASHLAALRASIDSETDAGLKALKIRLERLLTIRFDPDEAARIDAIGYFSGDLSVDVRASLNPLLATRRLATTEGPAPEWNLAGEVEVGAGDFSPAQAYALLVGQGLARPRISPAEFRAALIAHIADGKVGGVPVAELDSEAARERAYAALADQGLVPATATAAELAQALDSHRFFDVYAEPAPAVTDAARATLHSIETKLALNQFADLSLDALSLASIYFLAAIGLAITFGVMGVINMAHGEFIMMGAYTGYVVQTLIPNYTVSILVALPLAFAVTFAAGVAMERLVIRWLYNRPLETLLATFGISIALQQIAKNIFGTQARPLTSPGWLDGALVLNDVVAISYIRIAIFVLALFFLGLFLFLMKRTRFGLDIRAVTQNPAMAASMGINPDRVNMLTFGLGSGIAGIAGVAIGLYAKVTSELGSDYIVQSFMTVVVGGVGNIWGALFGATMIGFLQKGIEVFNPSNTLAAQTYMIIFIIIFIQFRPRGIIALKGRAAGD